MVMVNNSSNNLADLNVGSRVFFKDMKVPYRVKAKRENFLIAVGEDGEDTYTIIDTDAGYCGPHDRIFNPYNFRDPESLKECLDSLVTGRCGIKISRRHGAPVETVLDMNKTLGGSKHK